MNEMVEYAHLLDKALGSQLSRAKDLTGEIIAVLVFMENAVCSMGEGDEFDEEVLRGIAVELSQQLVKLREVDHILGIATQSSP